MATDPRDWRQLAEAGSGVAAFLDLDEMLRRVVSYVSESTSTEASSILLHDPETAELVVAAAIGRHGEDLRGRRFPDNTGIAGAVLKSGEPLIANDLGRSSSRPLSDVDRAVGDAPSGLMAAPSKSDRERSELSRRRTARPAVSSDRSTSIDSSAAAA